MKKMMIERLANFIRRAPTTVSVNLKRKRLSFEVKAPTYQLHTVNVPEYGAEAISFILEKEADGGLFVVAKSPEKYGSDKGVLNSLFRVQIASEADGVYLITEVNRLLSRKLSIVKVMGFALLAWLGYLFVSAYIDIVSGKGPDSESASLSSLPAPVPALPQRVEQAQFAIPKASSAQSLPTLSNMNPDSIAKQIFDAAEAARKKGMRDNAPVMSSDVATGLESFGLAPSIDAGQSVGPGCDPKLAFQVAE
ncbi:hypothetical protein ACLD9I_004621 [Pseudomonas aeruginosa]